MGGAHSNSADVWALLHSSSIKLSRAHHTARDVPHTGDLARAIQLNNQAEELIRRHAPLTDQARLEEYGPAAEPNYPEIQSQTVQQLIW